MEDERKKLLIWALTVFLVITTLANLSIYLHSKLLFWFTWVSAFIYLFGSVTWEMIKRIKNRIKKKGGRF